ncbi:hypothetical protein KUTeg_021452 [Tegillarca granosa]|uniref:Uncharacterized protein n=1 Tax=Tegillarca granosa TaxID=220873 RepID=A0ABQ9E3B0_TEGGR|nr:hypothetical protein KUTeg_021452 [Tegillarca granosa]
MDKGNTSNLTSWEFRCNFWALKDVKEIENDEERREQFTKIVYTLQKLTQSIFNLPTTTELLEVFGKFEMVINSFTICDGEMQSIGVGVYLGIMN